MQFHETTPPTPPPLPGTAILLQYPMANVIRAALATGWWALMMTACEFPFPFTHYTHLDMHPVLRSCGFRLPAKPAHRPSSLPACCALLCLLLCVQLLVT